MILVRGQSSLSKEPLLKPLGTGTSHGVPEGFPRDATTVTCACRRIRKRAVRRGLVGEAGFEPATPWPPAKCAAGLRYSPNQSPSLREDRTGQLGRACAALPVCRTARSAQST